MRGPETGGARRATDGPYRDDTRKIPGHPTRWHRDARQPRGPSPSRRGDTAGGCGRTLRDGDPPPASVSTARFVGAASASTRDAPERAGPAAWMPRPGPGTRSTPRRSPGRADPGASRRAPRCTSGRASPRASPQRSAHGSSAAPTEPMPSGPRLALPSVTGNQSHTSGAAAASEAATIDGSTGPASASQAAGVDGSPIAITAPQALQRARVPPAGTRSGSIR